jgi:1-acyl-sn-glycerol-3-phosphate acyltransferase
MPPLRSVWRTVAFCVLSVFLVATFLVRRTGRSRRLRSAWAQDCARRYLRLFGVELDVRGPLPGGGVIVSNHLGYLDIVVFAACRPMVFVSKSEVGSWPGIGTLAGLSGTIFLDRARKSDLARASVSMREVVAEGIPVLFFPEGTSSGGAEVLPFHAGLFAPAAEHGWSVTPAWIGYGLDAGDPAEIVAYWRDMTFVPHFLRMMGRRRIRATVRFGSPLPPTADRKALAAAAHAAVDSLRRGGLSSAPGPSA